MSSGATDPLALLFAPGTIAFVMRALVRLGAPHADLEDLAQDVMVIAMNKWRTFDATQAVEPWLWGIARNRLRDFRDLARHRVEVAGDLPERASPVAQADVLLAGRLQAGLARLSDEVQMIVVLDDLESWTLPECSRRLGISLDVAKYRLSVGRQALRKHLEVGHG